MQNTESFKNIVYYNMFKATFSGSAELLINFPLITIKNLVITKPSDHPIYKLANSYKNDGILTGVKYTPSAFRHFYTGMNVMLKSTLPIYALQIGAGKYLAKKIHDLYSVSQSQANLMASVGAGLISSILYNPAELRLIQISINKENTYRKLVQKHGVTSLSRGFFGTVARESLFTSGYMCFYQRLDKHLTKYDNVLVTITGNLLLGIAISILTQPFDTVKSIQQSQLTSNHGFIKTAQMSIKELGVKGLYLGGLPRSLRITLALTILNKAQDLFDDIIDNTQNLLAKSCNK